MPRLSEQETANYSKDLLKSLRAIAAEQRHFRLAELLEAAAEEAERLSTRSSPSRE